MPSQKKSQCGKLTTYLVCQSTVELDLMVQTNNYFANQALSTAHSEVLITRPKPLAVVEPCIVFKLLNISWMEGNDILS